MKNFKKPFWFIRFQIWISNFFAFNILKKDEKMAKKIEDGLIDFEAKKAILMLDIQKVLRKKLKKGRSLYIPLTKKNKAEIKAMIEADFGSQMKQHHLKLTDNLKLV
jgi:tRNA(Ser,Leu) C12 N-acetylase TAN1